jgi:sodium-dependent phosphate transporter
MSGIVKGFFPQAPNSSFTATAFNVPYKPVRFVLPINKDALPFGPDGNSTAQIEWAFEHDYYWMVIAGGIFAFGAAYGLGANDVANAFGTSVGSKSLRLVHAIMIASVFEFLGAFLLGASVSRTISGNIANPDVFDGHGDMLMLGFLGVLVANTIWQLVATRLDLNVSSTHSVVGATVGFCLVWAPNSVNWDEMTKIIISWFVSPVLAGVMSSIYFLLARKFLLRQGENAFQRCLTFFPVLVFFAVAINCFFVGLKGFTNKGWAPPEYKDGKLSKGDVLFWPVTPAASVGLGLLAALMVRVVFVPVIRRNVEPLDDKLNYGYEIDEAIHDAEIETGKPGKETDVAVADSSDPTGSFAAASPKKKKNFIARYADRQDELVHGDQYKSETVKHIWDEGEVFPYRAERVFNYLQVFTAILASFAHGAGDVSHSVGPFSAILSLYQTNGQLPKKKLTWPTEAAYIQAGLPGVPAYAEAPGTSFESFPIPAWMLAMGGAGIVVGMATYGYRLMRATGTGFIMMTPSRGACAELGFVSVIIVGSVLGIPLSSSHCITGAIVGVGIVERGCSRKGKAAVNWCLLGKYALSWLFTVLIAAGISAFIFAFAIYSPARNVTATAENCIANGLLTNFARSYTKPLSIPTNYTIIAMKQNGQFTIEL